MAKELDQPELAIAEASETNSENSKHPLEWVADSIISLALMLGSIAASASAFVFLAMGFLQIWKSCASYYNNCPEEAIYYATTSLEFFLISPLSYFIIRVLLDYVIDFHKDGKVSPRAKALLIEIKALSVGLLFAITATHVVGKILQGESLTLAIAAPAFVLMGILGLFFFGLEFTKQHHKTE